jgi:hypothetical protein
VLNQLTSDEQIEIWESIDEKWQPVRDEITRLVVELTGSISLSTKTPDMQSVRFIQGQLDGLRIMSLLPTTKLNELKKGLKR